MLKKISRARQSNPDHKIDEDTELTAIIKRAMSRRSFLKGASAFGFSSFFASAGLTILPKLAQAKSLLGFKAVEANQENEITIPDGYGYKTLISWGDPILPDKSSKKFIEFNKTTRGTAASQENAFGGFNDGMHVFSIKDKHGEIINNRAILVVNNEHVEEKIHNDDDKCKYSDLREELELKKTNLTTSKVKKLEEYINKEKNSVGISVVEIEKKNDEWWHVVPKSQYNRRINADTKMKITGPARGNEHLKTHKDPDGEICEGTFSNCGSSKTKWGTYLSCEENFDGYFTKRDKNYRPTEREKYYDVGKEPDKYSKYWSDVDERFDPSNPDYSNESNRFGYVVEVDPMNPNSMPKKRTALGRFKHENAEMVFVKDGEYGSNQDKRIAVYLGDDQKNQYLYKYVSKNAYQAGKKKENGDELLENGTLYVAKFSESVECDKMNNPCGKGEWIELRFGNKHLKKQDGFKNQAGVFIFTREAAKNVGATSMDRPEWVAAHPKEAKIYVSLTNNKKRKEKETNGPNPRAKNIYGQIICIHPEDGDHSKKGFTWDMFVMAGNPEIYGRGFFGLFNDLRSGTPNITKDNMFNGPDGLAFDDRGCLWIQTDGETYENKSSKEEEEKTKFYKNMGNNQMLAADPNTKEIKRFLIGPIGCEVTGLTWSPDKKTMFVGIQHPEKEGFPPDAKGRPCSGPPRSSVIAIRKKDGGIIGT